MASYRACSHSPAYRRNQRPGRPPLGPSLTQERWRYLHASASIVLASGASFSLSILITKLSDPSPKLAADIRSGGQTRNNSPGAQRVRFLLRPADVTALFGKSAPGQKRVSRVRVTRRFSVFTDNRFGRRRLRSSGRRASGSRQARPEHRKIIANPGSSSLTVRPGNATRPNRYGSPPRSDTRVPS